MLSARRGAAGKGTVALLPRPTHRMPCCAPRGTPRAPAAPSAQNYVKQPEPKKTASVPRIVRALPHRYRREECHGRGIVGYEPVRLARARQQAPPRSHSRIPREKARSTCALPDHSNMPRPCQVHSRARVRAGASGVASEEGVRGRPRTRLATGRASICPHYNAEQQFSTVASEN